MSGSGAGPNMDDRGVSVAITHALTIAITTVLVSVLLIASGGLLDSQQERVGEEQLSEIGNDAASHIHSFDRLNETGEGVNATVRPEYPNRLVDSYRYELALEDGDLVVRSDQLGVATEISIENETRLVDSAVPGNEVEIRLCEGEEIRLGGCER